MPPSAADPPSTIRTPAPVAHPDPAARRQNDSHYPRRFPPHPDARLAIPDLRRTAAAAIACVAGGSSSRVQTLKGRHFPFCHGILLLLNWPGSAQLATTTQTLGRGRAWPFQDNSPPNNR